MTEEKAPRPGPPDRIFSAMQPTGELHLGNYLGALANWVVQAKKLPAGQSLFCVVDQHALTIDYDPKELPKRTFDMAVSFLAGGVDPEYSIVFVQSHVPEHTELAWYLSTVTQFGELGRMTQFKDKSEHHQHNVNTGLFTYPVLMAADILAYKATLVPVGDDQTQHLELARDVAHRFNTRFAIKRKRDVFPLPRALYSNAPRIMGVDGLRKMSKSLGNHIGMLEPVEKLRSKLKPAFTDPQRLTAHDPGRPELCNIFRMHTAVTPEEQQSSIAARCRSASIGCGDCKALLGNQLNDVLGPVRERAAKLNENPDTVRQILAEGARKAQAIASETLREVRERMGLR